MRFIARALIVAVVLVLLAMAGSVQADLKATAPVSAWDVAAEKYQNSNVVVKLDGGWVPFIHELNFDNDEWGGACGDGGTSPWAGNMYYGLYHEDNAPAGAPGFLETMNWELVHCDRDGDGDFDNGDLAFQPPAARTTVATCPATPGGLCRLVDQDVETPCTTGNCTLEIVTTLYINLDLDCDGALDSPLPPGGLCFFAEGRTPLPDMTPQWSGPLQARISTVGGEKTVNFSLMPTAVDLIRFEAAAEPGGVLLSWETAMEVDTLGFNLYRREGVRGALAQLNDSLIPGQGPGSPMGFVYTYRDQAAAPGTAIYYWLEELDVSGAATRHGPVWVITRRAGPHRVFLPAMDRRLPPAGISAPVP